MKRKWLVLILALALAGAGWAGWRLAANAQSGEAQQLETEPIRRGSLQATVSGTGMVRANQTAVLVWRAPGGVERVEVQAGDTVNSGQLLASLRTDTLPQYILLAQIELIQARRDLDHLLHSQLEQAEAQKAVEDAARALEDANSPTDLAQYQKAQAAAQQDLDRAKRDLALLTKPASAEAIQQAQITVTFAERNLAQTQAAVDRIRARLNRPAEPNPFFNIKVLYRKLLRNLEMKLAQDQRAYEEAVKRQQALMQPPNSTDVLLAEARLSRAQAELNRAERDLAEARSGPSAAEVAVLEAQLEDARREWERIQDGPTAADIAAAQARLDAAQASLDQAAILAPFAGVVTQVIVKPGDQVLPGSLAFRLDDLDPLLVDIPISEIDINRIRSGQPATLTFDAIPGLEYNAEVVESSPVGSEVGGVASFNVRLRVLNADAQVKPGMTVEASIIVGDLSDALLVPSRAVRMRDEQRGVYILVGGDLQWTPLTLGISSGSYSEVVRGDLVEGDLVVLNPDVNEQLSKNE